MAEINTTLLMQRLASQLDRIEHAELSTRGTGGGAGGTIDSRLAKVEAHIDHMRDDVHDIRSDLKSLLWAGIAGFAVTWSGIIGLALLAARGFGWLK